MLLFFQVKENIPMENINNTGNHILAPHPKNRLNFGRGTIGQILNGIHQQQQKNN